MNIKGTENFFNIAGNNAWDISVAKGDSNQNSKDSSFGDMLLGFVKEVNTAQNGSSQLQQDYIAGKNVEPHELMMSKEKANMMLNLTVKVRDDIVKGWNELIKIS